MPMPLPVSIVNKSPHNAPAYQTQGAAGMDLCCWLQEPLVLQPMERRLVPTGLFIALPQGYEGQVRPRSGTAFKRGLSLVNSPGTIDADYRGEIMLPLINLSGAPLRVEDGERVAQLVVARVERVEWQCSEQLDETQRAAGGFGHTGH